MFDKLLKAVAPVAGIAMASALSGCSTEFSIDGEKGVPLAELDMSGDAPHSVVLAGPDKIVIKTGKSLKINVEGDDEAVERIRFTNSDGTLGVLRQGSDWGSSGSAVINVTMPAPKSLTIAGSGSIDAASLAGQAEANLLGSGSIAVKKITAEQLEVAIMASGSIEAAGSADKLELSIMGSGGAEMPALKVDAADVTVAGSGSAAFASDGKVKASIMGSGSVRVVGRAECEVSSMGSGSLKCEAPAQAAAKPASKKKTAAKKKSSKKRKG